LKAFFRALSPGLPGLLNTNPTLFHQAQKKCFVEFLKMIFAIILPPLGVFLQVGIGKHF
jgi:hypothetical protein